MTRHASCGEGFGHLVGFACAVVDGGFAFGEDFEAEVAATFGPFVGLFSQYGADEPDDRGAVGEESDRIGTASNLSVEAFVGVVGSDLLPKHLWEAGEREDVVARAAQVLCDVDEPVELGVDGFGVGLAIDRVERHFDGRSYVLGTDRHKVRGMVGAAALPAGAGQIGGGRFFRARVRVAGDKANAGEAAGDQVGEESIPGWPGLAHGEVRVEDLAATVSVESRGDQHDRGHHAAPVADFHRQCVRGHEREWPHIGGWQVLEVLDQLVQIGGHPRDLRLEQQVDTQRLDQLVHPPRGHPR